MKYQLLDPLTQEEYAALEADIRKRGVMVPVERDQETGEILDGHNRHEIATRLGLPCPEVVRRFASEAEKREHVVKMNLARRHLDPLRWGKAFSLLLEERGVQSGPGARNDLTSLTLKEVAAEVGVPLATAEYRLRQARTYDTLPASAKQKVDRKELTVSQAKQEVRRQQRREEIQAHAKAVKKSPASSRWRIVNGDCIEELRKLKPGSVGLIFADPPYNIGVDYGDGDAADALPPFEYLRWCAEWMEACHRVLAADGSLWVLINHEHAALFELLLRGDVFVNYKDDSDGSAERIFDGLPGAAFSVLAGLARFHVRSWVTWYETFGVNCSDKFNRCSRRLLYCVKDPQRFTFNADAVTRPSDRQAKYNDARANPSGKLWDDVWQISRLQGTSKERLPDFPTQLPLELLTPIVDCCSSPGDLVVDPFNGSGTTGEAALRLGRRYVGIEKQARFAELAKARLHSIEEDLSDGEEPQASAS